MKRIIVTFSILAIFAGVMYAADSASIAPRGSNAIPDRFGGAVNLEGKTARTAPGVCWVDNTARTIDNLVVTAGGVYLGGSDNTLTPIAVHISCDDNTTRWGFGNTPTASIGHRLPGNQMWTNAGPDIVGRMKGIAASATDNVPCAITLWY